MVSVEFLDSTFPSEYQALIIQNVLHVFPFTILLYDHLLTFDDESQYIWNLRKTISSYFFFLNRYVALVGNIPVVVQKFVMPFPPSACKKFQHFRQGLLFWNQVFCAILLSMRVYALYDRNRRILFSLVTLAVILFSTACWAVASQHSKPGHSEFGCYLAVPEEASIRIAIPWKVIFIYDLALIILTLYKTFTTFRSQATLSLNEKPSLVGLILRDGVFYFLTISLVNMGNALTYHVIKEPFLKGCLSTFSSCVSVTLVSRLMLNLHKTHGNQGLLTTADIRTTWIHNNSVIELDTLTPANL